LFESDCHGLTGDLGIVARLGLGGRDVADGLEEAPMVEPIHPFEGGELDCLDAVPGAAPADHLGLEQADDGLGESIVIGIVDAADRGFDASIRQALGVADRDVLAAVGALLFVKRRCGSG
jgi:hypothetical protein